MSTEPNTKQNKQTHIIIYKYYQIIFFIFPKLIQNFLIHLVNFLNRVKHIHKYFGMLNTSILLTVGFQFSTPVLSSSASLALTSAAFLSACSLADKSMLSLWTETFSSTRGFFQYTSTGSLLSLLL